MLIHAFESKSYAQVSSRTRPPCVYPPKRITRSDWESYAIAWEDRAGGFEVMLIHPFDSKSYAQVSLRTRPPCVEPPKRITRSDWESYASAWDSRAGGFETGSISVQVLLLKS